MTLLEYRKSLGKTQAHFADMLGISQQQYQRWESGEYSPTADSLMLMSERLNLVIQIRPDTKVFEVFPAKDFKHSWDDLTQEDMDEKMDSYSEIVE